MHWTLEIMHRTHEEMYRSFIIQLQKREDEVNEMKMVVNGYIKRTSKMEKELEELRGKDNSKKKSKNSEHQHKWNKIKSCTPLIYDELKKHTNSNNICLKEKFQRLNDNELLVDDIFNFNQHCCIRNDGEHFISNKEYAYIQIVFI